MRNTPFLHIGDEDLWMMLLKGDKHALSVIYKRNYELLLNFGLKIVPDEELVKDCIQDVFVKIGSSKRLSATEHVRSYLLTSLKNRLADTLAALPRSEQLDERHFQMEVEDEEIATLFKNNDKDILLSRKLIAAYNELPSNQRMAIYLRYVRSLSYKEIAAMMHINPQSSMNLVSRALTSLRKRLSADEFMLLLVLLNCKL